MYLTLKEKLQLLKRTVSKIEEGTIKFDSEKENFGFNRLEQLFPVSDNEIKGYPCIAYNKPSDPLKFGVKIIPMENKYDTDTHPCRLETRLLKDFRRLVLENKTPHITFYFADFQVKNTKKALVKFPLKALRHEIYKTSDVLVAEYVSGGSIEEWLQLEENVSESQWKYIIFSMAWTLMILHEDSQFMHNDFHYGNVLVDTSIDASSKTILEYVWKDQNCTFQIRNPGIVPKMWDFEFANSYQSKDETNYNNCLTTKYENVPHEFNPYFDLHHFLTSLLELVDLPDSIQEFILSIYPPEVIPELEEYNSTTDTSSTTTSEDSMVSFCSNDSCSCCFSDSFSDSSEFYYKTDEESTNSVDSMSSSECSSESSSSNSSNSSNSSSSSTSSNSSSSSEESEVRTEFLLGGSLLNGTEKKFKLPTPKDVLMHSFFDEYRVNLKNKFKTTFTY